MGSEGRMEVGVGWVGITHGGKSLHMVFWDIGYAMFEGFQEK